MVTVAQLVEPSIVVRLVVGSSPISHPHKFSGRSVVRLAHLVWDEGVAGSNPAAPTIINMKKAKIYIPSKTAMQSGRGKLKKWVLEFETKDPSINPLMGWETSSDTLEEVVLKFSTKEQAVKYAKKNNISYKVIEPKKKEFVIKSYADNFLKN